MPRTDALPATTSMWWCPLPRAPVACNYGHNVEQSIG